MSKFWNLQVSRLIVYKMMFFSCIRHLRCSRCPASRTTRNLWVEVLILYNKMISKHVEVFKFESFTGNRLQNDVFTCIRHLRCSSCPASRTTRNLWVTILVAQPHTIVVAKSTSLHHAHHILLRLKSRESYFVGTEVKGHIFYWNERLTTHSLLELESPESYFVVTQIPGTIFCWN